MGRQFIIFLFMCFLLQLGNCFADSSTDSALIIPIPQPHPAHGNHPLKNMTRDTMIYMLTAFMNPLEGSLKIVENPPNEGRDWVLVTIGTVVPEALDSFKLASSTDSPSTAFQLLKDLLGSDNYLKNRNLFHRIAPVTETLQELKDYYHFTDWEREIVELSTVKGTTRIIYRSPKTIHPISIAQTLMGDNSIRETEIIIAREDLSQQFDFYAYNKEGVLTQTSLFHSHQGKEVRASVPYTCLTCHYNSDERAFQRAPSSYSNKRMGQIEYSF